MMKKNLLKWPATAALVSLLFVHYANAQQSTGHDMEYYITHAPFKMPAVTEPHFNSKIYNIKDYGAVADGQTLNTAAFEKAITACSTGGGGTVLIPPGLWLTGPIELKSNVNLHADRGALITFSTDHTLYPIVNGKAQTLLSGTKLENVAITGEGVYDGGGETWRPLKKSKASPTLWSDMLKAGGVVSKDGSMLWPTKEAMEGEEYLKTLKGKANPTAQDYLPARDFLRPTMVSVQNSKNVLIDGPTFKNSPQFALNPKNCTNMIIRNVTIFNEYWAQNGDAIDLSSCKNSVVYRCTVHAGDDGICMKSSGGKGDALNDAALKNIVIADCIVYHAHGGFVIGSNTDGGMQNVYVTNCNFVNTDVGIRVKSSRGRGGPVRDIYIDNVYMHDILNEAVLFSTYYEDEKPAQPGQKFEVNSKTPIFSDFYISHVYGSGAKSAISITGLPERPVSKIHFSDVVLSATKPVDITEASTITMDNVKILSPQKTLITANNAWDISLKNISFDANVNTLINATGEKSKGITVSDTDLKNVKVGAGSAAGAVKVK
ncbi:glycoside hydrolase family 28 protein [Mucilaginibacter boryungensis]|uniref:Glycoside hydrolase family 28 protein n=1 Tax=Mucilaginibacter boryungensis TaxID=768480 RepID=A0ABR9XFD8_9SPHI|nr:glycoside hydrolase family 28 protein [Mucilaginibacter boryungensis]MBE9665887.1 glycoside hydrolase family 28 protein [Mucilaginibacter boryungensis]